jgi:spore coat protein U-like protein
MNRILARKCAGSLIVTLAGLSFGTAHAGTTTPLNVNVTASVASTCQATATKTDVGFGAIAAFLAAPQTATGTVTFTCNKGATVGVTVSNGANYSLGQSATLRAMKSGTADYISYHIYQPTGATFSACAGTTEWTASLDISALWSATGGPKTVNLCGQVDAAPASGYATGASYADVVSVQATF